MNSYAGRTVFFGAAYLQSSKRLSTGLKSSRPSQLFVDSENGQLKRLLKASSFTKHVHSGYTQQSHVHNDMLLFIIYVAFGLPPTIVLVQILRESLCPNPRKRINPPTLRTTWWSRATQTTPIPQRNHHNCHPQRG